MSAASEDSDEIRGTTVEGTVLGRTYRLVAQIGSGGTGDVFHAEHVRLGSPVAIKLLRRSDHHPRSVQRFLHEARTLAAIRSDHIVRVFDYGETPDGTPYLVMERLFGEDLRALLAREGPLLVRRAVRLLVHTCRGLCVMHAAGLVHRDLKPANLFVESIKEGTERCKILDFGVAKEMASDVTHPGSLLGTIRYMAPEQLEDARSATVQADVYALGAILFEALAGRPANAGSTQAELMFSILHRDAPRLGDHVAVPPELEAIVRRALARDPGGRFSGVDEFARALAPFGPAHVEIAAATGSDATTIADASVTASERRGSHPKRWVVVGALALGLAGGWVSRPHTTTPAAALTPPSAVERRAEECTPVVLDGGRTIDVAEAREPDGSATVHAPKDVKPLRHKRKGATPSTPPSAIDPIVSRFDLENPY